MAPGQDSRPIGVDSTTFASVFRHHPAGVAVVTMNAPEPGTRPVGFTATSVISVSATPPVLAFVVSRRSSSWPALSRSRTAVVHFLPAEASELSVRFATHGIDRFDGVPWHRLPTGEPRLEDVSLWARTQILDRHPAGDSYLVTAHVLDAVVDEAHQPLIFHDRAYHRIADRLTG